MHNCAATILVEPVTGTMMKMMTHPSINIFLDTYIHICMLYFFFKLIYRVFYLYNNRINVTLKLFQVIFQRFIDNIGSFYIYSSSNISFFLACI